MSKLEIMGALIYVTGLAWAATEGVNATRYTICIFMLLLGIGTAMVCI